MVRQDVRTMIHNATAMFLNTPDAHLGLPVGEGGGGGGTTGAVQNLIEAGHILSAMARAGEAANGWLWWAYGAKPGLSHRAPVLRAVRSAVTPILAPEGKIECSVGALSKLMRFEHLAIEEYKMRCRSGGEHKMSQAEMAEYLGVHPNNWGRDWRPLHQAVQYRLADLDQRGLDEVNDRIEKIFR